jgi:general secretion pathway protein G
MSITPFKKGFTLIELMIIIAILGVLAAIISANLLSSLKKGRDTQRKGNLESIKKAVELYYEDKKAYPTDITWGSALCETAGCVSGEKIYMQVVPADPLSSQSYSYSSDGTYYRLYACMENDQQILPADSVNAGAFSCSTECLASDGTPTTDGCIYGISDPGSLP